MFSKKFVANLRGNSLPKEMFLEDYSCCSLKILFGASIEKPSPLNSLWKLVPMAKNGVLYAIFGGGVLYAIFSLKIASCHRSARDVCSLLRKEKGT